MHNHLYLSIHAKVPKRMYGFTQPLPLQAEGYTIFFFFLCLSFNWLPKEFSLPYLPIAEEWTVGFMPFPRTLVWNEKNLSRIWTLVTNSISLTSVNVPPKNKSIAYLSTRPQKLGIQWELLILESHFWVNAYFSTSTLHDLSYLDCLWDGR